MAGSKYVMNFIFPLGLIIYGSLYKYKASKKISYFFGYKTSSAQLSKQTWEYANKRVGDIWIKLGALYTVFVALFIIIFPSQREKLSIVVIAVGLIIALYTLSIVEKELKEKFNNKGDKLG